ncbi:MAG: LysM peptidoglycan-binding domain-containing protein [bacterium]
MRTTFRILPVAAMVVAIAFSSGCGGPAAKEQREERDPTMKRAQARKQARDADGAIELFNKALEHHPGYARAHLELGLLYDQDKEDFVRAIYHYQRYLELRPDAEKKDIVEDLVRHAKLSFAASLPDQPSEAVREINMLKGELESLKSQLGVQQAQRASVGVSGTTEGKKAEKGSAAVTASATPQALQPAPAQSAVDTYVVQAGDTLSRIAGKVYKDSSKWEVIFNANRATLPGPQSLKVGQTLVIPRS